MSDSTKLIFVGDSIFVGVCVGVHAFGAAAFLFCLLLVLIGNEIIVGGKR